MNIQVYMLLYLAVVSVFAILVTAYDKAAAKTGRRRIPEKTLMLIGFFGGATAMYGMMQFIRHKTKHKKFMLGLPLFIIFHLIIIVSVVYYL